MNITIKEKLKTSLLVSTFLSLTLFLFGPLQIYYTNQSEFYFRGIKIIPYLIAISLLSTIILICILVLFKNNTHKKLTALVLIIGFLLWLQGNILLWHYGQFNGNVRWNDKKIFGLIDSFIWGMIIIFAFIKYDFVFKIARKLSIAFLIIQLITISIYIIQARPEANYKNYTIDDNGKFSFSKDKNIVILTLDTFQNDIFQEIINENKDYKKIFKGFTYFRNAAGGYPSTLASIPLILTGEYYDNSVPFREFLKKSYLNDSIPKKLKEEGYDTYYTNMYYWPSLYLDESIASNIKPVKYFEMSNSIKYNFKYLVETTLFRYSPHYIKQYLYNKILILPPNFENDRREIAKKNPKDGELYADNDDNFVSNIIDKIDNKSEKNTFKYYHLWGIHRPILQYDKNLNLKEIEYNRSNIKKKAILKLELVKKFFDALKANGTYDNTMIFIVGDHGAGLNIESSEFKNITFTPYTNSLPLILVKSFNTQNDLQISDNPVSLADIKDTIFNGPNSMFGVKNMETYERRFFYYNPDQLNANESYFPPLKEYIIHGNAFSWFAKSWERSYRIFEPGKIINESREEYKYGSVIKFGKGGNAEQYEEYGWSYPEKGITWTYGKEAKLNIPIHKTSASLILKAYFIPSKKQIIYVLIGYKDKKIGEWKVEKEGEYNLLINNEYVKNNDNLVIRFRFPNIADPSNKKQIREIEALGVAFITFSLSEIPVYEYGSTIKFGSTENGATYLLSGWSDPEEKITWTNNKKVSMLMSTKPSKSDLTMEVSLIPFIVPNIIEKQTINIYLNDKKIGVWIVKKEGNYKIYIPKKYLDKPYIKFDFELPNAASPKELKINSDERMLGIAFQYLVLSEIK